MLPVKGIKLMIISVLLASLLMPFTVFANSQNTIIVPTWDSSTTQSQWDTHLTVENYCEGTNASTNSCKLMFTVDSNYYGYIYFDGYSGNTKWMDFQMVFIADGYGEYNYNLWSNGQISINKVNIAIVNLVRPDTTVDLTQIIQLLTAIETDTDAIESYTSQTLNQIRSVLSQLIISNGYLEILSKLRQYNVSFASYSWLTRIFSQNIQAKTNNKIYYFNYPVYDIPSGFYLLNVNLGTNSDQKLWIFFMSSTYMNESTLSNVFNLSSFNIEYFSFNNNFKPYFIYKICLSGNYSVNQNANYNLITNSIISDFIPLSYGVYNSNNLDSIVFAFDNELATFLEVNNREFNYLNIIANGTTQSNSASSDLQSTTSDFQTSANQYYTIENTYNNNMNNQLQNIDTTTGLNGFGGNFLTSANWVRVQFNNLTNGNPFGSLVTYGLTLGLALLLLGKVFL